MGSDGDGRVEAGYILRDEVLGHLASKISSILDWAPYRVDLQTGIVAWLEVKISGGCVPKYCAVDKEVDIDVRHCGRVVGRIGHVDHCVEYDAVHGGVYNFQAIQLRCNCFQIKSLA